MKDRLFFTKQYWPVTDQIAFVEMDAETFAQALLAYRTNSHELFGLPMPIREQTKGDLGEILYALLPLTSPDSSELVVGIGNGWTAYFANGSRGSDTGTVPDLFSRALMVRTASMVFAEPQEPDDPQSFQFVVYDGRGLRNDPELEYLKEKYGDFRSPAFWRKRVETSDELVGIKADIRAVTAHKEHTRWEFAQSGTPFDFEDLEAYKARQIKDRMTIDMIEHYCQCLGIDIFNVDAYAKTGFIVRSFVPPNAHILSEYPNQVHS